MGPRCTHSGGLHRLHWLHHSSLSCFYLLPDTKMLWSHTSEEVALAALWLALVFCTQESVPRIWGAMSCAMMRREELRIPPRKYGKTDVRCSSFQHKSIKHPACFNNSLYHFWTSLRRLVTKQWLLSISSDICSSSLGKSKVTRMGSPYSKHLTGSANPGNF